MRAFLILLAAAGAACGAQTYTATLINTSTAYFANIFGLNNKGQVLGDVCDSGSCFGVHRYPAIWSNGVMTPLPMPKGCAYNPAIGNYWTINDSGVVAGWVVCGTNKVAVWTNGVPTVLPDAPLLGAGNICTNASAYNGASGSSIPFGINAAGHIVGETSYPSSTPGGPLCSAMWVYNGSTFRVLEYGPYPGAGSLDWPYPKWPGPIPSGCWNLPLGYYPGVSSVGFGTAINDADFVVQTENNYFCSTAYTSPAVPWSSDPFVTQPNNSYSFLPLGSLTGVSASSINNLGMVLGYTDPTHVIVWDMNGVHDLGPSGYPHLNQVGQVIYTGSSGISMWQGEVSTPISLPTGLFPVDSSIIPGPLNDAGQFIVGSGTVSYLMTPNGPCAQDVTSQVQITRTGFRYDHTKGLFALIGSVTNTTSSPIPGPISLVVDDLPASASLFAVSGATLCATPQGSPYINIGGIGAGQVLAPGATISGSIYFIDTAQTGIPFSLRVLAGPGGR